MSLTDFFKTLLNGWRTLLLAVILATISASGLSYLLPRQWEAEAIIATGTIGGTAIESSTELISRLRSTNTITNVLLDNGIALSQKSIIKLRSSTRLTPLSDSVEIRVRAPNTELARKILGSYFTEILKQHTSLSAPKLKALQEQADKIKQANQTLAELLNDHTGPKSGASNFGTKLAVIELLFRAKDQQASAEEQLSPLRTEATHLQNPVDGMPEYVSPDHLLITLLGSLAGLALAIIYLFSKNCITTKEP